MWKAVTSDEVSRFLVFLKGLPIQNFSELDPKKA
jgi:hypothetical protein